MGDAGAEVRVRMITGALGVGAVSAAGGESRWCNGKDRHQRDAFKTSSEAGAELGQKWQEVKGAGVSE